MRLEDFRDLVRRQAALVPSEFLDGVIEVTVSPRAVPHPSRAEIFTLGECIPVPTESPGPEGVQSRVVLYHGSFQALAQRTPDFDWREEAWETLTHELRHHVEWRAHAPDLEAFDLAAEQNFARMDGEPFDPLFYRDGEAVAPGVFRVDGDYFLEQAASRRPAVIEFDWHGRRYRGATPPDLSLPAFLSVDGVEAPPPGDLVVVLRRRPSLRDLFTLGRLPQVYQAVVQVVGEGAPSGEPQGG